MGGLSSTKFRDFSCPLVRLVFSEVAMGRSSSVFLFCLAMDPGWVLPLTSTELNASTSRLTSTELYASTPTPNGFFSFHLF